MSDAWTCPAYSAECLIRQRCTNKCGLKVLEPSVSSPPHIAWWRSLTDAQRLDLRGQCCSGCGTLDTSCQCDNDE